MKKIPFLFFIAFTLMSPLFLAGQTTLSDDEIERKLLAQPPQAIIEASEQSTAIHGTPDPIQVTYMNADLDGNGSFAYFIGFYSTESSPTDFFMRVFKRQRGDLIFAGGQDSVYPVGGPEAQLEFVDVNNDGIPEIEVTSLTSDARDHYFSLFSWTGTSLHDMAGGSVMNAGLVDIDNDGILEIVHNRSAHSGMNGEDFDARPDTNNEEGFDVLTLTGNEYRFFKTFKQDPTGTMKADGTFDFVTSYCTQLQPASFSLAEIAEARAKTTDNDRGVIHLMFGGLQHSFRGGPAQVNDLDTSTVVVSPHLIPKGVSVHPRSGNDFDHSDHNDGDKNSLCSKEDKSRGSVRVDLSRSELLNALQKLQLYSPLEPGDQPEVNLKARLKDGTPVSASFRATITGPEDNHEKDTRNKRQ